MGVTIGGNRARTAALSRVNTPMVYVRKEFGDGWTYSEQSAQSGARFGENWTYLPDFQFQMASLNAIGNDLDRAEFQRPYGAIVDSFEQSISIRKPISINGWWVVIMFGEYLLQTRPRGTTSPHWIGRIYDAPHYVYSPEDGDEEDGGEAGVQRWVAYGPRQLLRLTQMAACIWTNLAYPTTANKIEWVPAMNGRNEFDTLVGNRSPDRFGRTYIYTGRNPKIWTHYDYAEYVLYQFMGVNWYLGGQAAILKGMTSVIRWGPNDTIDNVLRKLIPIESGLDYFVRWRNAGAEPGQTWNAGWEVVVFTLQADPVSFGSVTLPGAEESITINLEDIREVESCRIVPSNDHLYKRVVILGKRAIVCCTPDSMVRGWTFSRQLEYNDPPIAGASTNPNIADAYRRKDSLRDVYRRVKVYWGWDMNYGTAAPQIGYAGVPIPGAVADWQTDIRATLRWLPLDEDTDYSVWPPVYTGPANTTPGKMAPAVWVPNVDPTGTQRGYILADAFEPGFGVSILPDDWGFYVQSNPNHLIALSHFFGYPTNTQPIMDYSAFEYTLAFESDQRAKLVYETPKSTILDDTKILMDDTAEFWYLAPETVVGTDGNLAIKRSGSTGRILRNDITKLERAMCGAIARYTLQRWRCEITLSGFFPWQDLIGKILLVDDGFGTVRQLGGPVTQIQWLGGQNRPITVIRAGYAE